MADIVSPVDTVSLDDPVYLEPLGEEHDTASFCSRAAYLDWYLSHRALTDQKNDLSRTIVAVNDPALGGAPSSKRIEGFVTLEAGTMPTATILNTEGSQRFRHGFEPFTDDPKRLFLPMSTIRQLFQNGRYKMPATTL